MRQKAEKARKFSESVNYNSLQALQFHLNFSPEPNLNHTSDIVSDTVGIIFSDKKVQGLMRQNKVIQAGQVWALNRGIMLRAGFF